jgi:hypothetical protein
LLGDPIVPFAFKNFNVNILFNDLEAPGVHFIDESEVIRVNRVLLVETIRVKNFAVGLLIHEKLLRTAHCFFGLLRFFRPIIDG